MDTSALTIDNLFAAPAPKVETRKAESAFCPVVDDGAALVDSSRTEGTDNVLTDTVGTKGGNPAREFRHVLREKTKGESPPKNQKADEPKQSAPASDSATSQKPDQKSPTENGPPVPQNPDVTGAGVKSKAGSNQAQLTTGVKSEKSFPVTGHAAKSAQIKALAATGEKGQLGLKTVLPPKSNGLNGLKVASPEASTILPATKAQPGGKVKTDKIVQPDEKGADAKTLSNSETVKELSREAPDDSGAKTSPAHNKQQVADIPAQSNGTKAPAQNAKKNTISEVLADADNNKAGADGKKAPAKNTLTSAQAKVVEKPSQLVSNESGKHLTSAEADGKRDGRQTKANSSKVPVKEPSSEVNNAANELNAKEVHKSESQPGNRGRSATNHGPTQNFEQMLAHSNPHSTMASQSAAATAKGTNLPGQSPPGDASADIGRQILESIQNSASRQGAERQVTVRLNPPELGQVFIKLQEQNSELTGVLEVSRSQTRFEIEHALPEIIRNLADSGIHVRRLDVMLSEQGRSEQEAFGGQSMANNGRYEHNPADQRAWADEIDFGSLNEWSANNYNYQSFSEPWESLITEGSINMLI